MTAGVSGRRPPTVRISQTRVGWASWQSCRASGRQLSRTPCRSGAARIGWPTVRSPADRPTSQERGTALSEHAPQHVDRRHRHRALKIAVASVVGVLVVVAAVGLLAYQHLNRNITSIQMPNNVLGSDRPSEVAKPNAPTKPLNILLLGSDTRKGQTGHIGGDTPGLSDTTILLHVSADRKLAYGVSLPRDAMVQRPTCKRKDGNGTDPGGLSMFNAAYAVGGPACTIKTVEKLTNVRINHFVVIDFNGFKQDGRRPRRRRGVRAARRSTTPPGHITLPAGTYNVKGQRALDYVRVRHDIGTENGDIGRMKRQQAFLASMANKAVSAGTLANPVRLYKLPRRGHQVADHRPRPRQPRASSPAWPSRSRASASTTSSS